MEYLLGDSALKGSVIFLGAAGPMRIHQDSRKPNQFGMIHYQTRGLVLLSLYWLTDPISRCSEECAVETIPRWIDNQSIHCTHTISPKEPSRVNKSY